MHDDGQERGVLNFVNIPYRNKPPCDFDTPPLLLLTNPQNITSAFTVITHIIVCSQIAYIHTDTV